ncbi:MAG: hypothetical protein LBG42_03675 [Treponema sp.]|jgi:hypothetical protein|nr:hypothetical protein [Treponema sp.]
MKRCVLFAAGLFPALAVQMFMFSCSTGGAIEQAFALGGRPPEFLDCKAVSAAEVVFRFSLPVKVVSIRLDSGIEVVSVDEGSVVTVGLGGDTGAGKRVMADMLVEDGKGNTLNVLVPFRTRNERLPPVLLTELRTEYSNPNSEFIEFKTLSAGNLGALRLFIAGNVKKPLVYEFSPMEVAAGEYILLHLRTMEAEAADETGGNLDLSGGKDAVAGVRDLWVPGKTKLLRKTDAVYFLDQDDHVVDAVLLSENPDSRWSKEHFTAAAELLGSQEAWRAAGGNVPGPQDAVITAGIKTAMTRSVSRDEKKADANAASDWYVTPVGGISPGKPNSP